MSDVPCSNQTIVSCLSHVSVNGPVTTYKHRRVERVVFYEGIQIALRRSANSCPLPASNFVELAARAAIILFVGLIVHVLADEGLGRAPSSILFIRLPSSRYSARFRASPLACLGLRPSRLLSLLRGDVIIGGLRSSITANPNWLRLVASGACDRYLSSRAAYVWPTIVWLFPRGRRKP